MKTLIWKDYRNHYALVLIAAVLLMVPIVISLVYLLRALPGIEQAERNSFIAMCISGGTVGSLALSQITLCLLGGQVIATERRERTAEFLYGLPPSRLKIVLSKLTFCGLIAGTIWGLALILGFLVVPFFSEPSSVGFKKEVVGFLFVLGLCLFGSAWFGSAILESPTYATGLGVLSPTVIFILVMFASEQLGMPPQGNVTVVTGWMLGIVGVIGIIAGCWCFVRRLEP